MLSLDWENEEYTYEEILRHFLEGISDSKYHYRENVCSNELEHTIYSMIDSVSADDVSALNLEELDKLGITGDVLVKLWELCKCNPNYFKKTVGYITGTYLSKAFSTEEVMANLSLKRPYPFIPDDNGLESFFKLSIKHARRELDHDEYERIISELRNSLVRKYNSYVSSHPDEGREKLQEIFEEKLDRAKVL